MSAPSSNSQPCSCAEPLTWSLLPKSLASLLPRACRRFDCRLFDVLLLCSSSCSLARLPRPFSWSDLRVPNYMESVVGEQLWVHGFMTSPLFVKVVFDLHEWLLTDGEAIYQYMMVYVQGGTLIVMTFYVSRDRRNPPFSQSACAERRQLATRSVGTEFRTGSVLHQEKGSTSFHLHFIASEDVTPDDLSWNFRVNETILFDFPLYRSPFLVDRIAV